jgi:hypothetical protein
LGVLAFGHHHLRQPVRGGGGLRVEDEGLLIDRRGSLGENRANRDSAALSNGPASRTFWKFRLARIAGETSRFEVRVKFLLKKLAMRTDNDTRPSGISIFCAGLRAPPPRHAAA